MFSKARDKTKQATLKLRAKVTPTKTTMMADAQTVSLTSIPMVDANGVVAPPPEKLPSLYTAGRATQPTKKSAPKDIPDLLTPTAPPIGDEEALNKDKITKCDTATVTATETTTAESPDMDPVSTSDVTTTDQTESQEEGASANIGAYTGRARPPKKTRKFRSVYLTKTTKVKQFRPCSPISNSAAYPVVRYQHAAQFKAVAKELNTLVQFFNLKTIAPFLYDEELQFFLADYRQQQCKRLPFLKFAMEHMFEKYCLQASLNVNRTLDETNEDEEEGEWVDIDDDSDDEISFPIHNTQVSVTQSDPPSTEQWPQTTRQQDEYLDDQEEQVADLQNDIAVLNESIYLSADDGEYDDQVDDGSYYEDTQEQYYTPGASAPNTDTGLYYNLQQQNVASNNGDCQSHAHWSQNVVSNDGKDVDSQGFEETYPDTGYASEISTQNPTQQQLTEVVPIPNNTTTYTHRVAQDEFMGHFDDIDEIAYTSAKQVSPQIVRPKTSMAQPRTVLIHERLQQVYQQPLTVHQVHGIVRGNTSPKKVFPPP